MTRQSWALEVDDRLGLGWAVAGYELADQKKERKEKKRWGMNQILYTHTPCHPINTHASATLYVTSPMFEHFPHSSFAESKENGATEKRPPRKTERKSQIPNL